MATTLEASPRLKQRYENEIKGQLKDSLGLSNIM